MQYRPDITILDQSGATAAMVEVKALHGEGVTTATRYLRNLLAHGVAPADRFILLITADTGYLWPSPEAVSRGAPPSLTFPMDRIVQHYLSHDQPLVPVRDLVLEAIVQQWLSDLADGIIVEQRDTGGLRESGFVQAIRAGSINVQSLV